MDRLDAMAVFVAVADTHSFTRAARQLRRSPSQVTRLVAALEARLETQLLRRTTRAVALTDAGARYLEQARRIVQAAAEADDLARADRTRPSGRFVVAAPTVFGRLHIAPIFARFLGEHGAVRGELQLADRVVDLVSEGVDVAIRIGHLADSSLRVRVLGSTRHVVVGSASYFRDQPRPRTPRDLTRHRCIHLTPLGGAPEWLFSNAARHPFTPSFITNSVDAAIDHARRGGGLVRVLAYQVEHSVAQGELEIVLARHENPPLPIQVVYPEARLSSATLRAFVEALITRQTWRF